MWMTRTINTCEDALMMEPSHITTKQQKICIKFYNLKPKVIYEATDLFQQPDCLVCKNNQNLFCKSCCANSCDDLIGVLTDMYETDFGW